MKQQFDKMMKIAIIIIIIIIASSYDYQTLQGRNGNNNASQATAVSANNQDIIILGSWYAPGEDKVSNTVEQFNIVEGRSTELPQMSLPRAAPASCVYNGDVIVTGGRDGQDGTDSIETLKMNQYPLRWAMFGGKLPAKLSAHAVTVYQDSLYIVGGRNWNEDKISDAMYKMALASSYNTPKLLPRMPQARHHHRAEIVNGRLFILGGTTTIYTKDVTDSVLVYDFITNEFNHYPSLPKPVWGMSTVTWGNKIIVIGGADKNGQVLNGVIMYDTETGRSEWLPSLNHKRRGPSAVIMHDVIVVLGGENNELEKLNSVESFTIGGDRWIELPGMKERRSFATAVVKPCN